MKKRPTVGDLVGGIRGISEQIAKAYESLDAKYKALERAYSKVCSENNDLRSEIRVLELRANSQPARSTTKVIRTPLLEVKVRVAEKLGMDESQMQKGSGRTEFQAWARQIAMALCYRLELGSHHEIAEAFGYSEHGSSIWACRVVNDAVAIKGSSRCKQFQECEAYVRKHVVIKAPEVAKV